MKRILCIITCLLLTGQIAACSSAGTDPNEDNSQSIQTTENSDPGEISTAQREIFAMDTYMTLTAYGDRCEEALDAAEAEIEHIEGLLSVGIASSEISVINSEGQGRVSAETGEIIDTALHIYETTDGAFDITVYPLMELWGFTGSDPHLPSDDEIQETLGDVGSDRISVEDDLVQLDKGQGIDLGGIAKGYTSDRIMEIFEEYDLVSGMVSLGGNVAFYGAKTDGSLWRCGIRDPFNSANRQAVYGIISVSDRSVITSGAYERYFEENGIRYHHILDPSTGYPAESGIVSATIVGCEGVEADALSTACYVMGIEKSEQYWKNSDIDFDMILIDEEGDIYITEGIADSFESDHSVNVIRK